MPQKGFEAQPISSQKLQSLKSKHFTRSGGQVRHKKIILGIALSKICCFFLHHKKYFSYRLDSLATSEKKRLQSNLLAYKSLKNKF